MLSLEVCLDLSERQPELKHGLKCPINGMGVVVQFNGTTGPKRAKSAVEARIED